MNGSKNQGKFFNEIRDSESNDFQPTIIVACTISISKLWAGSPLSETNYYCNVSEINLHDICLSGVVPKRIKKYCKSKYNF